MIMDEEIAFLIERKRETELVINTIKSKLEYYSSLLWKGKVIVGYREISARTTYLGLAALCGNAEVLAGLLEGGFPPDGMDAYNYITSLQEEKNYNGVEGENWIKATMQWQFGWMNEKGARCWSTITEVLDRKGNTILTLPWSTPVLLAVLSENHQCLNLLLRYGAICDLRQTYYAQAVSLCENESILETLARHKEANMIKSSANVLLVFNEPLARKLYQIGKKPEPNIVNKLMQRAKGTSSHSFGDILYDISSSRELWDEYYESRYENCIRFYTDVLEIQALLT